MIRSVVGFFRVLVTVAAVTMLLSAGLSACSSSGGPPPPDRSVLVSRLSHDASLKGALLLVASGQRSAVFGCTAAQLRADAKSSDLAQYVAGKRSFSGVGARNDAKSSPSGDLAACVRKELNAH